MVPFGLVMVFYALPFLCALHVKTFQPGTLAACSFHLPYDWVNQWVTAASSWAPQYFAVCPHPSKPAASICSLGSKDVVRDLWKFWVNIQSLKKPQRRPCEKQLCGGPTGDPGSMHTSFPSTDRDFAPFLGKKPRFNLFLFFICSN